MARLVRAFRSLENRGKQGNRLGLQGVAEMFLQIDAKKITCYLGESTSNKALYNAPKNASYTPPRTHVLRFATSRLASLYPQDWLAVKNILNITRTVV